MSFFTFMDLDTDAHTRTHTSSYTYILGPKGHDYLMAAMKPAGPPPTTTTFVGPAPATMHGKKLRPH